MSFTASQFANIAKAQDRFRFSVVKKSKENLSIRRSRKTGSGRTVTSAINSSKSLSKSIKSSRKNLSITFSMLYYGEYVNDGRKPGKWPPVDEIKKWIKVKPIKPRDERGRFVRVTDTSINSLAFLIGRAIYKHGIQRTDFFTKAYDDTFDSFSEEMELAILDDLDIVFTD